MKDAPRLDKKEFEIPETVYSRDIETRVIQVIIAHCLGKINGVGLLGGNLIDSLFGRDVEKVRGIHVEQDPKTHSVKIKIEVNVDYGVSIPGKAEEMQVKVVEEITRLTGLHVASIHIIIKGLNPPPEKNVKTVYPMLESEISTEDLKL